MTKLLFATFRAAKIAFLAQWFMSWSFLVRPWLFRSPRRTLLFAIFTLLWLPAPFAASSAARDAAAAFFNSASVPVFKFEIAPEELNLLRRSPRSYVRASVSDGENVFRNVGVHLKGMSSFRPLDEKPSLAVKFNRFDADQDFHGLTRLLFNNSVQDPTYLAEYLATGLFRDAGLPAARVTHARVLLNGRDLGLYVVIEGINRPFLKRWFKDGGGNLYEGFLQDIDSDLEQDGGAVHDRADLRSLLSSCSIPDPKARFPRLARVLDTDRFASFAGMEMLVGHWDGYIIHTNNYRLYHDPASGRFVFITHGLDWAFRRPNMSIQPSPRSIVGHAFFDTAEGRAIYRERIGSLYSNVFRLSVITNRMNEALQKLRAAVPDPAEAARMEKSAAIMRERIVERSARVADQLAGLPPKSPPFDRQGLAPTSGWRAEFDRGEPLMNEVEIAGRRALHTRAGGGRSRGSWRTQVYLPPGHYRFEGRVKTAGLVNGSVALRVSGETRTLRLPQAADWQALGHAFEVGEGGGDIELICEFYGAAGDAWFDLESLKVRRL